MLLARIPMAARKPPSAMSWKLNAAEKAQVDKEVTAAADAARATGSSNEEVEEIKQAKAKEVERRLKQEKFDRRPAAAGAAAAAVPAAPAPAPALDDPRLNAGNQLYLADLEAAIGTILNCPAFKNIKDADPLPITNDASHASGVQSVFDAGQCAVALDRESRYIAACNFWWQNLLASPTPGVPLRKDRVMDLACHLFNLNPDWEPGQPLAHLPHLKSMIVVLVDSAPEVAQHNLLRVSPEEIAHAVVFGCAREVAAGVPADRLARWRTVFLSCCFCFELRSGPDGGMDAAYWKSFNLRQSVIAEYAAVRRTARQMAHEIFLFKRMKETETGCQLNKKQVAALYQERGRVAKDHDPISENYIATCLNVYEKIVSVPSLAQCIEVLESRFNLGSCLAQMTNLQVIITRTDDTILRTWVMQGIVDAVLSGALANDDITKSALSGSPTTVSLCTLLQFKRQVLTRYLNVDLPKLGVNLGDLDEFRAKLATHATYRAHVRGMHEAVDTTWKARCCVSSILALDLLEDPR